MCTRIREWMCGTQGLYGRRIFERNIRYEGEWKKSSAICILLYSRYCVNGTNPSELIEGISYKFNIM